MKHLSVLDEMTNKECRVFLYCKVLGLPPGYTAETMNITRYEVEQMVRTIDHDYEVHQLIDKIKQYYDLP